MSIPSETACSLTAETNDMLRLMHNNYDEKHGSLKNEHLLSFFHQFFRERKINK